LGKSFKNIATRCQILRPKILQKSTSAGAPPYDPTGPGCLQRSARPPSWNKGDLLLSEGRNIGMRREDRGHAGEGRGREREEGREWRGPAVCIFKISLE